MITLAMSNNTLLLSLRMVSREGRTAWFCVTSQTRQSGSTRETSSPLQAGMVRQSLEIKKMLNEDQKDIKETLFSLW